MCQLRDVRAAPAGSRPGIHDGTDLFTARLGLHYIISKFVATGIVFFFNFFVRKFALFNKKKESSRVT